MAVYEPKGLINKIKNKQLIKTRILKTKQFWDKNIDTNKGTYCIETLDYLGISIQDLITHYDKIRNNIQKNIKDIIEDWAFVQDEFDEKAFLEKIKSKYDASHFGALIYTYCDGNNNGMYMYDFDSKKLIDVEFQKGILKYVSLQELYPSSIHNEYYDSIKEDYKKIAKDLKIEFKI